MTTTAVIAPTTPGAERGQLVLALYDPDPNARLFRVLADLAEYAEDMDVDFMAVATFAHTRAKDRREARSTTETTEETT